MIKNLSLGLSQDFGRLLKEADDYNVIIEIGEGHNMKRFRAHSVILRARSQYFHTELSNNRTKKENGYMIFKQPDVSPLIFDIIMVYLYSGEIILDKQNSDDFLDLLNAADLFSLHELIENVQNYLIQSKPDWIKKNIIKILHTSHERKSYKNLLNYCDRLIAEDAKVVFESPDFTSVEEIMLISIIQRDDLGMKEIEIWDKVIEWGIAKTYNLPRNLRDWKKEHFLALKQTIHQIIPHIRLFQMTPVDYCHKVRPYKQLLAKSLQKDLLCYYLANDHPKSTIILPPRVSPIKIDSVIIGPQHTALISQWLDNDSSIKIGVQYDFNLLFRANRDCYSLDAFIQQCSGKGPVILVARLRDSGQIIGGYNPLGWKDKKIGPSQGTKDSFIFTLSDGKSPYDARIARIVSIKTFDKDIDDLAWHGPRFGKGPDLWVKMNSDQSGEARKSTYESGILENEGRFRWVECEIFSVVRK